VTVHGNRLYLGDGSYFPSTHFLHAGSGSAREQLYSHLYLSPDISDSDRSSIKQGLLDKGHNTIYIYTFNENDYKDKSSGQTYHITPYKDALWGGDFDDNKLADWHQKMQALLDAGLRPVLWLFPDDSPTIKNADTAELKRYINKMVQEFDDLPIMYVLALEADEYWSSSRINELGEYLGSLTVRPVGLHQLNGKADLMRGSWVDFGAYQYGFDKTWQDIYTDTLDKRDYIGAKPLIGAEYDLDDDFGSQQRGLAAAFAWTAGVGNGAPVSLDEFMAALPDDMVPSRSGDTLCLQSGDVVATADMNTLDYSKCEGCDNPCTAYG